jgi:phosphonopyruvate decarboxylase
MIDSKIFVNSLSPDVCSGVFGVPDSLLKSVNAELETNRKIKHITSCNEGSAVGLGIGSFLATGVPSLVYMQNSGLGNAINPLVSLANKGVYGIPMVLLIGWRGMPGEVDEPQHKIQGEITIELLDLLGISTLVLPENTDEAIAMMNEAFQLALDSQSPVALIARKGTFQEQNLVKQNLDSNSFELSREEALGAIYSHIRKPDSLVSTTGMLSRELNELIDSDASSEKPRAFYVVGGMGHASSIALGVGISDIGQRVWCLDGDGAAIMHMGALTTIANQAHSNFVHVVFENGTHDSVGGQPLGIRKSSLLEVAKGAGYESVASVAKASEIEEFFQDLSALAGPVFLSVKVRPGNRSDVSRPKMAPSEHIKIFMGS